MNCFYPSKRVLQTVVIAFVFLQITAVAKSQMRQVYQDTFVAENHINKISFFSPSQGYVAFSRWIGYTADSGRTFVKKYITFGNVDFGSYDVNITFGFLIAGVKALNQSTIIVYGNYGFVPAILYSNNGGNSFRLVFHSQYNPQQLSGDVTDVVFPQNSAIGYATDADRILKTTNGGLSWSVIRNDPAGYLSDLEAIDDNNLFAFSRYTSKILKTSNGGAVWLPVTLPVLTEGRLLYAYFLTVNKAWVSMIDDSNGKTYIYKTIDGGGNWTLQNNPDITPFSSSKMKFLDDNIGYALHDLYNTYKTEDGGKIWEPLPRDNDFNYFFYGHNDLQFINNNQFWSGGRHGFLEITTNGGGTPLPRAFFSVDTTGVTATGTVNLVNYSKPGYQFRWFVNNVQISTNYHTSYTHNVASGLDSIKLIVSNGVLSDTLVSYRYFIGPIYPSISSFNPTTGSTSTFVTITGTNFTGISNVLFGGVPASSFIVVSPTTITAVVGNGGSGNVSVINSQGTFSLAGFQYFPVSSSGPPVVNSFSPASGVPGTVVTISGSNFNTDPGSNIIYFGATRAAVTSASSTEIICVAPVGASYQPITVLNTATHLTGDSFKPFNVVFADSVSNFTNRSFTRVLTFTFPLITMGPKTVAGADLDNDGRPDLISAVTRQDIDSIAVYRNTGINGNFSFANRQNIGAISDHGPGKFAVQDIDGDGKPDLIGTSNTTFIPVFRNTSTVGNISFTSATNALTTSGGIQDVMADDLDNDGKADLIGVGASSSSSLIIVRNTSFPGNLSFTAGINYSLGAGGHGYSVATGDLDNDGKKDVVVLNNVSTTMKFTWFKNTGSPGTISFTAGTDVSIPGSGISGNIFVYDVDGDNKLDVVVLTGSRYALFRNQGTAGNISFAAPIPYVAGGGGAGIGNLSGNARPDFVHGNNNNRNFTLYRNSSVPGSITQNAGVSITNDIISFSTNVADFNGDGKDDIAFAAWSDGVLSIYKNVAGVPLPLSVCENGHNSAGSDVQGSTYQWQEDHGSGFINVTDNSILSGTQSNSLSFSNTLLSMNGYKYRCLVDGTNYSSMYALQVTPVSNPEVSISASVTSICYGTSVTFTATGTGGGTNPVYRWQVNGLVRGTNSPTFTTNTLNNNDQVRVIFLANVVCPGNLSDTSNVITMAVTGGVPSATISTNSTTICAGSSATFTAVPVNGGTSPSYQWQVNGFNAGTNSNSFIPATLNNGDIIKVIVTPNGGSCVSSTPVTSNSITITVTSIATPSVAIGTPATTVCQGSSVTFTATPTNGGSSPAYQWQVNGINAGTNSNTFTTSALNNNDQVRVILTSNAPCVTIATATSFPITITISTTAVIPSVNITGPAAAICMGSAASFTATPTNGGASPSYQWQVNNINVGSNSNTYNSTSLTNNAQIKVILTSNAACASPLTATSNVINMIVKPDSVPSIVISGAVTIAQGQSSAISSVNTNTGSNPGYKWQDSTGTHTWQNITGATNTSLNYTPLATGDKIRCIITSTANCVNPATVTSNVLKFTITTVTAIDPVSGRNYGIRLYPNPVNAVLTIDTLRLADKWQTLEIISMNGKHRLLEKVIVNQVKVNMNVGILPGGIYFAILKRKSGEMVYLKFVKQ